MEYTEEESNQDIKIFETNPELDQSTSTTPNLLVSAEKVALVSFFKPQTGFVAKNRLFSRTL